MHSNSKAAEEFARKGEAEELLTNADIAKLLASPVDGAQGVTVRNIRASAAAKFNEMFPLR